MEQNLQQKLMKICSKKLFMEKINLKQNRMIRKKKLQI